MKKLTILFLICILSITVNAQAELFLGGGYKAYYTPPAGWVTGNVYNGEHTFYTTNSEYHFSIKTTWKNGRSATEILNNGLSQLSLKNCKDEKFEAGYVKAESKNCNVNVGPRVEGRLWMVLFYKDTRNAIEIAIHYQSMTPEMEKKIKQSIEQIRYVDPS